MREIVPWIIGLLPFSILFSVLYWEYQGRKRRLKFPFTKYILRPPGESLRVRIESLDETIYGQLLGVLAFGILAAILIRTLWNHWGIALIFSLPFLVWSLVLAYRLRKSINLRRDCYLGFLGERAIGEELNQLIAAGWSVFHDVEFKNSPGSKPFNVDHVVIGSGGLFAIETKTRRKVVGGPVNSVIFDGTMLHYPWGNENFGIRNAVDRAAHLQKWLSDSLQIPTPVQAVLALPGWSVTRKARGEITVISGGEIAGYFRDEHKKNRVDPRTLAAVRALLDQKCRDVGD